jgi:signal transduction histidine kinase
MRFMIQDMLDLAQIKSGKFRKNISEFNIKKSVQKVMDIQSQQAVDKKLALTCEFIGFHDDEDDTSGNVGGLRSPIIKCDENRVMQVLLGL